MCAGADDELALKRRQKSLTESECAELLRLTNRVERRTPSERPRFWNWPSSGESQFAC